MTMSDQPSPKEWWKCPVCGEQTRVCTNPYLPTKRMCTSESCDWEFTFPTKEELEQIKHD